MERPAKRPRLTDDEDYSLAPLILGDELPELWDCGVIAPVVLPEQIEFFSLAELRYDVDWSNILVHYRLLRVCRRLLARHAPRIRRAIARIRQHLLRIRHDPPSEGSIETVMGWRDFVSSRELSYALGAAVGLPTCDQLINGGETHLTWRRALAWGNAAAAPSLAWLSAVKRTAVFIWVEKPGVRPHFENPADEELKRCLEALVLPSGSVPLFHSFEALEEIDVQRMKLAALPVFRDAFCPGDGIPDDAYCSWVLLNGASWRAAAAANDDDRRVSTWCDVYVAMIEAMKMSS